MFMHVWCDCVYVYASVNVMCVFVHVCTGVSVSVYLGGVGEMKFGPVGLL